MILVLAPSPDDATRAFAAELEPLSTTVLTYADLACELSALHDPDFGASTLHLAGRRTPVGEISGVVNLLPVVLPDALTVYDPEERDYQAAEMHAWLLLFLSRLSCTVVNRPTPLSLTGPAPSPLGWLSLARAAGVPLAAAGLDSDRVDEPPAGGDDLVEVVAVAGEVVRPSGTAADEHTARLARRHGMAYLKARYASPGLGEKARPGAELGLVSATGVPDLRDARARRALARLLGP